MRNGISGETGKVEVTLVDGAPRIRLVGECDVYTAPALKGEVGSLLDRGLYRLVFDLEAVTFLDSSILSIFLAAHRRAADASGEVVLLCRPGFVRRLLNLLEMDRILKIRTPEEFRRDLAAVN
jgi:anti-sigma B factor antagonist